MKKKIPYSVINFKEINNGEYYYVDKTRYIEELELWKVPMFLRPKRFGKSLWCSTLSYYYDVNYKDKFEQLFGNTYIGKHPTESHNKYAVMSFSFAAIDTSGSIEEIRENFNLRCHNTFSLFALTHPNLKLNEEDLPEDATLALEKIFINSVKNDLPPLYIIIDEYDNFTNSLLTTHGIDDYHAVTTGDSFLRVFYKAIKDAVGDGIVGHVFITGVLPITLDDLTSGFNIAMNASFDEGLLGMVGFSQNEVETLVKQIFDDYDFPEKFMPVVLDDLKDNYDGYNLIPGYSDGLYNSTICNFYLFNLVVSKKLPDRKFDPNLAIDRNWLKLMLIANENVPDIMTSIICNETVNFARSSLDKRFNAISLKEPNALMILLFHLGILTWNDEVTLRVPNQNQLVLLGQYCQELQGLSSPDDIIASALQEFKSTHDIKALFSVFWDKYIGLVPGAAFTHLGENFYRTSFFILCKPNMARSMDTDIEQNTRSGRYDMRFWGYALPWWDEHELLLEFKYRDSQQKLPEAPLPEDIAQVHAYAADQRLLRPDKQMEKYLVYIRGHEEWKIFQVED